MLHTLPAGAQVILERGPTRSLNIIAPRDQIPGEETSEILNGTIDLEI